MRAITSITLATACLISLSVIGCQTAHKTDEGAVATTSARPETQSEPTWTIGWSQLKTGMDAVEVLSLLDEPKHVKVTKINTAWYYSERRTDGPLVVFDTRKMRVERWKAPRSR